MSKGSKMLIANTKIFDDFINKIPSGDFVEIKKLRSTLAKQFDCDVSMLIERISGSCKSISSKSIQLLILLVTNV